MNAKATALLSFSGLLIDVLGFTSTEFVSLGYGDVKGGFHTAVMTPADAIEAATQLPPNANCYFGVNPIAGPARRNAGRGAESAVIRLAALWVDVDVKPGACPNLDIAKAIIAELGIILGTKPSVIVESGGGLHAYWPVSDGGIHNGNMAVRGLLKRWGRLVASVAERFNVKLDSVYDLPRMLRLPGSLNNKTNEPRPVTAHLENGGPVAMAEIAERLDEVGILTHEDDTVDDSKVLSPPADWRWADKTCAYVATMIAGFPNDTPKGGRNPWLLSQKVRLALAYRLGCITEQDHRQAHVALEARFTKMCESREFGEPRDVKKFEFRDTSNCAIRKAARKNDGQARRELGNHTHERPEPGDSSDPQGEGVGDTEPTTWEMVDLGPWLSGEHISPQPTVGISRTDGRKVIYAGREHTIAGETESGKTWFALECAAVEIRMGRDVLYIHYEEGDPGSTIERLRLLAVTPQDIAKHLRFVAPARPARGEWLSALLDPPPSLVIHDGVNEAMSLQGDDIFGADGAATFRRTLIKPCLAAGAATIACDHVTKNSESRGRYSYGSGHKINAVDGAAFQVENLQPFGRGLRGVSSVYVVKDRPGQLRAHGKPTGLPGKTFFGVLTVDASPEAGPDFLTFFPPKSDEDSQADVTDPASEMADAIYRVLNAMPDRTAESTRKLFAAMREEGIKFTNTSARNALDDLVHAHRIVEITGKNNSVGYQVAKSASEPPPGSSASASASCGASPIEGEAPTHSPEQVLHDSGSTSKHSEAPVREPYDLSAVCRYCSTPISPGMRSQINRGYCNKPDCLTQSRDEQC